ncbi:hypothetical protein [Hyphomicrobium sp.]|uniref:hypothetical protein n=1 Tax=Hyphomicrobium sp. TaxID=82 RepID=UPI002E357E5D|nr:hypothetical protein [Hyphomicrobium sp.]HEX2843151.1 hypothetical protein [Hyphomicrobium sp.]
MPDTRLTDDVTLRVDAMLDRIAATPIGRNADVLQASLADCDALEHSQGSAMAICKLRDLRHWLRLAYGDALHAYPADQLRRILRDAIMNLGGTARREI